MFRVLVTKGFLASDCSIRAKPMGSLKNKLAPILKNDVILIFPTLSKRKKELKPFVGKKVKLIIEVE